MLLIKMEKEEELLCKHKHLQPLPGILCHCWRDHPICRECFLECLAKKAEEKGGQLHPPLNFPPRDCPICLEQQQQKVCLPVYSNPL